MLSKERVFNTLGGEPTDHCPYFCMTSLYGARYTGCSLHEHYSNAASYVAGQRAVHDTFQPDILSAPFAIALWSSVFGGKARFFDTYAPNMERPSTNSVDEIVRLSKPDLDTNPHLLYFLESTRMLVQEYGDEVPIIGTALSPVDMPIMIMGLEAWMKTVLFDPDGVRRVLELTIPTFLDFVNAMFEEGAAVMALPTAFLTPVIATRKIVEEVAVPVLRDVFPQAKGPLVVHHVGSPFLQRLDLFADLPNTAGFVVDASDDLAKAREIIGPNAALFGGPDGGTMNMKTSEQVLTECLAALESRSEDPRFFLSTCGADIPLETPEENIKAMQEAIEICSTVAIS